ncbi:hypothetical protein CROQUDRAFT_223197 [Cronartium quercuum f. sp. fusiforme G11]|uniref:Uncharacterized protein n=1 Tax=Cronartium quercuum f. sp. fusiforme G11 TaxID=708437 RepID=A0A9P6NF81_9BASI|nr:hypothetical protein CROQUDRAFT_223197 [Cronartium quercuum f. sp. fusiforme G11]
MFSFFFFYICLDYKYNPKRSKKNGEKKGSKSSLSSEDSVVKQRISNPSVVLTSPNYNPIASQNSSSQKASKSQCSSPNFLKQQAGSQVNGIPVTQYTDDQLASSHSLVLGNKLYEGFPVLGGVRSAQANLPFSTSSPAIPQVFPHPNSSTQQQQQPFQASSSSGGSFFGTHQPDPSTFSSLNWVNNHQNHNMWRDNRRMSIPTHHSNLNHWPTSSPSFESQHDSSLLESRWLPIPISPTNTTTTTTTFSPPNLNPIPHHHHQVDQIHHLGQDDLIDLSNRHLPHSNNCCSSRSILGQEESFNLNSSNPYSSGFNDYYHSPSLLNDEQQEQQEEKQQLGSSLLEPFS